MPLYVTTYPLSFSRRMTTTCYAADLAHLAETMAQRRMGEELFRELGDFDPDNQHRLASDWMRANDPIRANHALVWISMIACRAGFSDAWSLMNDRGLMHEVAHYLEQSDGGRREVRVPVSVFTGRTFAYMAGDELTQFPLLHEQLARRLEAFERVVPGVHPDWVARGLPDAPKPPAEPEPEPVPAIAPDSQLMALVDLQREQITEALRIPFPLAKTKHIRMRVQWPDAVAAMFGVDLGRGKDESATKLLTPPAQLSGPESCRATGETQPADASSASSPAGARS